MIIALDADIPAGFRNSELTKTYNRPYHRLTNEHLLQADRLKGPAGTGERTGLVEGGYPGANVLSGGLAESWEIIQPDTIIYTIRRGVHWQNKPPVNGAELTAEDVVFTYMMLYGRKGSSWPRKYNFLSNLKNPEESVYVDPDDPWKVVFKAAPGLLSQLWQRTANYTGIFPKAAISPIEGEGFGDWKGVVGTGPFILTDRVVESALIWERNRD